MPRRRRTQSGAPAQRIASVPGQRYGEGVAQQQMQRELPAPNRREQAAAPAAAPTQMPDVAHHEPAQAALSLNDIVARAAQMRADVGDGLLFAPSERPDEPITTGLSSGPGAGPEILGGMASSSPGGRFLRDLSARTGNPYFAQLADRVRS